jgi:hypothetical protein
VRVDPNFKRIADPKFWTDAIPGPKIVSFADGYPFLMFSKGITQANRKEMVRINI